MGKQTAKRQLQRLELLSGSATDLVMDEGLGSVTRAVKVMAKEMVAAMGSGSEKAAGSEMVKEMETGLATALPLETE